MAQIISSHRICATCRYWTGYRQPVNTDWEVQYDLNERARCTTGSWRDQVMGCDSTCNNWDRAFGHRYEPRESESNSYSSNDSHSYGGSSGRSYGPRRRRGRRDNKKLTSFLIGAAIVLIIAYLLGYF